MAKDLLVSPNLAAFLHPEDESCFIDEDVRTLHDDAAFRERLRELEQSDDARNSASFEAWSIRSTIKDEISRSGEMATHDGSDRPTGIELPAGVIGVTPDGAIIQNHRRKGMSLTQSMFRNILGMKNLRISDKGGVDARSSLLPSSSNNVSGSRCSTCSSLQDTYGKVSLRELRQSRRRCGSCRLVVQVLEFYRSDLDGEDRVRIFAPLTKIDTLRIWCQGRMSRESEIPFMIEVFLLPAQHPLHPSIKPAVEISGDTSSSQAFAKARYWLHHCISSHEACASNTNVCLPTRLVRISYDPLAQRLSVKLVKTNNSFGQYACLSHCWGPLGSSGLLCTTAANYEDHLNEIPISSLPRTFQHALITTRRLGLEFIWIDSLCIIQRDDTDWAHEAARMGSYYSNGYVTIAASWSPCPSGGCFSLSEPEYIARNLSIPDASNSVYARRVLEHGRGWPLLTRGWVFQERMLSPRVLHFGLREMVWECLTSTACECGMSGAPQTELSSKDEYARAISTTQRNRLKDVWRDMVQRYTRLNLTYASDRFAAIAGVAKQMQQFRSSRYFARLWEDSMIGDMLWMAFSSPGSPVKPRQVDNKAPTWSWASVEAPWITYDHVGTLSGAKGRPESFDRIEETYAKILSISGEPLAEGNSGGSELGAIILQGSCTRGRIVHSPLYRPPSPESARRDPAYLEWYNQRKHELEAKIVLDNGSDVNFHADYNLNFAGRYCVRSGDEIRVLKMALVGEGDDVLSAPSVFGLVLRQIGCPNTYERVGLAEFRDSKGSDSFKWSEMIVLQIV